ncbi:MAG TPA: CBS domain-containing protein [Acidimicrobiales bacterium]|nr:CBS domain-containing protein [Acidimicrobiales bacterium]
MPETLRYVSRVARLPLLDGDGEPIGQVEDVVLAPAGRLAPRVLGFVTQVQRRRIFVNANRIDDLEPTGVRMRSGSIDVRPFRKHEGELLALEDVVNQRVTVDGVERYVRDVGIAASEAPGSQWELATLALGGRGPLSRRRSPVIVPWDRCPELFAIGADAAEVAAMREMRPADVANRIRALPLEKRQRLAELMEDERLADLLEELPEDEQVRLISGLDLERAADILEEMDPDDAADLLGEMSAEERARLLEAMEPDEATPVRRLLTYASGTAGGLMTPEPVIMPHTATVAEALARIREHSLAVALAAQVFVVQPPLSVPTGRFLGTVGFQRLLRHPPSETLGDIIPETSEFLTPDTPLLEVAGRLAAYDMVAVAVCDSARHLVGVVTIDDVMDHLLPRGWRRRLLPNPRAAGQ